MPQSRAAKEQVVETLSTRLAKAQSVYFADFTGLNVERVTQLRRQLQSENADCRVVKNTLVRFAVQNAGLPDLDAYLEGPTALIISDDPVAPAKVIDKFKKDNNGLPGVKGGLLNGMIIEPGQVENLASLPSREELIAKAVGGIAAPLSGLVFVLSGMMGNLVRVLAAVAAQRENSEKTG